MKLFFEMTLFLLLMGTSSWAQGGHVGGGGDPRRFYSARALIDLQDKIEYLSHTGPACSVTLDPEFKTFLENGFYNVVKNTSLEWSDEAHSKCAEAQNSSGPKVIFSYPECPLDTSVMEMEKFIFDAILDNGVNAPAKDRLWNAYLNALAQLHRCFPRGSNGPSFFEKGAEPVVIAQMTSSDFDSLRKILASEIQAGLGIDRSAETNGVLITPLTRWKLDHGSQLIEEVKLSPFVFDSTFSSCAHTSGEFHAPILINVSACRSPMRFADLAWTLTHEMVHHFPVEGYPAEYQSQVEDFADVIAGINTALFFFNHL